MTITFQVVVMFFSDDTRLSYVTPRTTITKSSHLNIPKLHSFSISFPLSIYTLPNLAILATNVSHTT